MALGSYVGFEGPIKSGKSTVAKRFEIYLQTRGSRQTIWTREPGAGPGQSQIADLIRSIVQGEIFHGFRERMQIWAEACLYTATRAQTLRKVVYPALCQGLNVIGDRTFVSSLAFQGGGRGLGFDNVMALNLIAIMDWDMPPLSLDWGSAARGEISSCIYEQLVAREFPEGLHPVTELCLFLACECQDQGLTPHESSLWPLVHPERSQQVKRVMVPDILVHMDISWDEIQRRQLDVAGDKFEAMEMGFHQRVMQAYFDLAGMVSEKGVKWLTVDGNPEPGLRPEQLVDTDRCKDVVFRRVIHALSPFLPQF